MIKFSEPLKNSDKVLYQVYITNISFQSVTCIISPFTVSFKGQKLIFGEVAKKCLLNPRSEMLSFIFSPGNLIGLGFKFMGMLILN
jgi:hypothetical protein